jgi:hypothetical protein
VAQVTPPVVVDPRRLPERVVVDKVVAIVGSRPITLSEVELELRLERAAAGDIGGASGRVTLAELADLLPIVVDRTVVLRGMRSQYGDTLDPAIAEKELVRIRSGFPSREEWDRFLAKLEVTEDEVRERRRRVLEFVTILDAAVRDEIQVKREDVDALMAQNPGLTREEAEKELLAEAEARVRDDIIRRKRIDLQATTVDAIAVEK